MFVKKSDWMSKTISVTSRRNKELKNIKSVNDFLRNKKFSKIECEIRKSRD